jgi:hypothetical protein
VYNELTSIALAHWIFEDGTFKGIILLFCTDSYSIKDVVILINILNIKFNIHCTIRYYNFPRIYVYKRYIPKLRSIV